MRPVNVTLSAPLLARQMRDPEAELPRQLMARLTQIERDNGNNDGVLAPRDVPRGDPALAAVMAAVWALLGYKEHRLDAIAGVLPQACERIFRSSQNRANPALADLFGSATRDALHGLARAYRREIWEGAASVRPFLRGFGLEHEEEQAVRRALPQLFATPPVEVVAAQYQRVLRNELAARTFYAKMALTAASFRELARAHPQHFPEPIPAYLPLTGGGTAAPASKRRREEPKGDLASMAKAVGELARGVFRDDPFAATSDIVQAYNARADLRRRYDRLTVRGYGRLRTLYPHDVPRTERGRAVERLAHMVDLVRAARRRRPGLDGPELIAAVQKKQPRFSAQWLRKVRQAAPELAIIPPARSGRPEDAERVAAVLRQNPGVPLARIAALLAEKEARFTYELVRDLADYYLSRAPDTAALVAAAKRPKLRFSMTPYLTTYHALALRLLPPGTPMPRVAAAVNRVLAAQGIPPQAIARHYEAALAAGGAPTHHQARVAAQVLVEYCGAAPKGAPEATVLAAMQKDYPSLTGKAFGLFRHLWHKEPERYPELVALRRGRGAVVIAGLGRRPAKPRFLGGWDIRRILDTAAREERDSIAHLTQRARVPLALPLLEEIAARSGGKQPLAKNNVLWITHLLADVYALADVLRRLGAGKQGRMLIAGTVYGGNRAVADLLEESGVLVRRPRRLSMPEYRRVVTEAVDELAARARKNGLPILIIDDGGLASDVLHAKHPDLALRARFAEQTTGGLDQVHQRSLQAPVIAVARSRSKEEEAKAIGAVIAAKVVQALARLRQARGARPVGAAGKPLAGQRAVVMGYGWVGRNVAAALAAAGATVTVVESNPLRAKEAAERFGVATKAKALATADLVVGATTGPASISLEDMRALPNGAVLLSASSKRRELAMDELEAAAAARVVDDAETPGLTLPTATYTLGKKKLTVLGDGWPVNFDGDVESLPPTIAQLTLGALLEGALQAAGTANKPANRRVIALDEERDGGVLRRFSELRAGRPQPAVSSLEDWRAHAERLAAELG